jgi:hypothetical protein
MRDKFMNNRHKIVKLPPKGEDAFNVKVVPYLDL